jgi:hypothetical protein
MRLRIITLILDLKSIMRMKTQKNIAFERECLYSDLRRNDMGNTCHNFENSEIKFEIVQFNFIFSFKITIRGLNNNIL